MSRNLSNSRPFPVVRAQDMDFAGESYDSRFPNLHKYPATMIPQLGTLLLGRHAPQATALLDPYCGSGSSFSAGLAAGVPSMRGYDLNPLAVLISRAKFTRLNLRSLHASADSLRARVRRMRGTRSTKGMPNVTNIDYWFSRDAIQMLESIRKAVTDITEAKGGNLFLCALAATIREVSFARNGEFKLYRMTDAQIAKHNPDVRTLFLGHLDRVLGLYESCYFPYLAASNVAVVNDAFRSSAVLFDVVLTSPPYGDSRTTVAYGQFSTLANEWLGIAHARKLDGMLMGGGKTLQLYADGLLGQQISAVNDIDSKRALEVSSFYFDLAQSIADVSQAVAPQGTVMYVVGNRRVKGVQLQTDQFIAEEFAKHGVKHVVTYERALSNKVMPALNSPSNKTGQVLGTMTQEFVVVCARA